MKKLLRLPLLLVLAMVVMMSCEKEDPKPNPNPDPDPNPGNDIPELTIKVNKFINDAMSDIYLWNKEMPDIDLNNEKDSKEYFNKLLFEDDRWSFATDDIVALENSFQGKEKSYGWSLAFGRFSNTGNIFAIVEYVYPETPAAEANIDRGDLIIEMNGSPITDDNYRDLLGGENLSITMGVLQAGSIASGATKNLVAKDLQLNPVVTTAVVEKDEYKIGYVFYAQYLQNYNEALDTAFQSMMEKQVTHLVLDLRYNPGGAVSAAQHLCSSLAPIANVDANSKLVSYRWNDKYQKYFTDNQIMNQIQVNFNNQVPVKMGLNKLYILTGPGSASASELTITGLKPYMDITTVGDTTHGKYTASITLKPKDYYESASYFEEFKNWGLQPIVLRYANSAGVTDFKNGFAPDLLVDDDLFATFPLGDENDPLFKAAIEDITGVVTPTAMKSAKIYPAYKIFDRGFSKYDSNKREMLVDTFEPDVIIK